MRGPITVLILAGLLAGCDREDPAPEPPPAATEAADEDGSEQASIIRPEMEVERPPITLEPLRATIPFGDGGVELSDSALGELRALLATDQWDHVERVVLRGHSDAGGSDAVNMRVSEERAQAVADWMIEQGLGEEDVQVIAFGAQNPIQPNLLPDGEINERGRAANRRVEVTILVPEGATIPDPGPSATPSGPPSSSPTDGPPQARSTSTGAP